MDDDLEAFDRNALVAEVKRLREAIREHRDTSGHDLCWHHPKLWGLLPERTDPQPRVPEWPEFMRGCVRYRQSLDEELPNAPRSSVPLPLLDPKLVVLRFNEAINVRDTDRLVALMTEDHRFIDSDGNETKGRHDMRRAWEEFFSAFPDYENRFSSIGNLDETVIALGRSISSVDALAGPAIWRATVRDGRVSEWRVSVDTPAVRRDFGIAGNVLASG